MKKIYFSPEMEIVEIRKQQLLAGSPDLNGGDYESGDPVLSPEIYDVLQLFEDE